MHRVGGDSMLRPERGVPGLEFKFHGGQVPAIGTVGIFLKLMDPVLLEGLTRRVLY